MSFKDHFSDQAVTYSANRPTYPRSFSHGLRSNAQNAPWHGTCATGNGQAALGLARWFKQVIASDASSAQIKQATPHPAVVYRLGSAEASGLDSNSVDLVTAAQAAHWFDHNGFNSEVTRVVRPGGAVAIWVYGLCRLDSALDPVLRHFNTETVGPYWPPERRLVECGYRSIPFPFAEIETPDFEMKAEWPVERFLGYLRSWSSTQAYMKARNEDPVDHICDYPHHFQGRNA